MSYESVTIGPTTTRLITDVKPRPVRKTVYATPALNPLWLFLLGAGAGAALRTLTTWFFGDSHTDELRMELERRKQEAIIRKDEAEAAKIEAQIEALRQPPAPPGTPLQLAQAEAIRTLLPYDEEKAQITVEGMKTDAEQKARLFPLQVDEFRRKSDREDELTAAEVQRFQALSGLHEAQAIEAQARGGLYETQAKGLELQQELIQRALADLPWWEQGAFLRERLFPRRSPAAEEHGPVVLRAIGPGLLQFGEFGRI